MKICDLRELLANLEHKQWLSWVHNIIMKEDGIPESLKARWLTKFIPYKDLTEEDKDKDRVWADKVLKIVYGDRLSNELD